MPRKNRRMGFDGYEPLLQCFFVYRFVTFFLTILKPFFLLCSFYYIQIIQVVQLKLWTNFKNFFIIKLIFILTLLKLIHLQWASPCQQYFYIFLIMQILFPKWAISYKISLYMKAVGCEDLGLWHPPDQILSLHCHMPMVESWIWHLTFEVGISSVKCEE